MRKKNRANFFLISLALLIAVVIYFLFMSEKAVAPSPEVIFPSATVTIQPSDFQKQTENQIDASVLMYHHVGALPDRADDIRKGLTVSSEEFDLQLKYLTENGYKFMTLSGLKKAIQQNQVPQKPVVLTFDDGYDDNYKEVLPIMKKYNAVGTFFIITSKIDKAEYMTRQQLVEIANLGNEIGSHTIDHPDLSKSKGNDLDKQIKQSKDELEKITTQKITSFCYPAGKFNDETIKKVSESGYDMAVTTKASLGKVPLDKLYEVPRYRISSNMNLAALLR